MKPRRFACVIAIVLAYTVLATQSFACTAFQLTSGDGSKIYFRSMEFGFPFNSNVLIIPRCAPYTGATPDGKPGLKWIAKYGAVGLNADVAPNCITDGMNEKGLVVGMLYLPGYGQFLLPDPSKDDRTIGGWQAAAYLLTTVATVEEAKQVLTSEKVYIAQQIFPPFKAQLPVHFYIGDASGAVVIAEYVNGKLNLHDDPLGVLTNSPPFNWQMTNLSNYVNLYIGDASGAVVIAEYVNGKLNLHDDPLGVLTNSPPFNWQMTNLSNYVNLSPVNVPEL